MRRHEKVRKVGAVCVESGRKVGHVSVGGTANSRIHNACMCGIYIHTYLLRIRLFP